MSSGVGSTRLCAALFTVAMTAGIVVAEPATAGANPGSCSAGWESTTLASDLGGLENLESDDNGGFYVTGIVRGTLAHVDAQRNVETLLTGLDHPAGVRLVGSTLYFITGDGSTPNGGGTLSRFDVVTRETAVVVSGLTQPNGLLLLPDGDLLVSQLSIPWPPVGIGRYRPSTGQYTRSWSDTPYPNGLALSADRTAIYTENDALSQILRIPLDAPNSSTVVAQIPDGLFPGLDDLDATRNGTLFVAGDVSGSVYQVDTRNGAWCSIVTNLINPGPFNIPRGPTSVRIAPDVNGWALYVTSIDGNLYRLRPPPGVDLTP
jgi:gluconolactonase